MKDNPQDEGKCKQMANGVIKKADLSEMMVVDINGVELASLGKWPASQGDGWVTRERLKLAIEGAKALGDTHHAPIKLGHDEAQKLLDQKDGHPSLGWIANLRMEGKKLIGDFRNVPRKLFDLIKAGAYRSRSAEFGRIKHPVTKKEHFTLRGVALLGADLPAVTGLDDIVALYKEKEIEFVEESVFVFEASESENIKLAEEEMITLEEVISDIDSLITNKGGAFKGKKGAPAIRLYLKEVRAKLKKLMKVNLSEGGQEEMDQKELAKLLGLSEDATEDEIKKAISDGKGKVQTLTKDAEGLKTKITELTKGDKGAIKLSQTDLDVLKDKANKGEEASKAIFEMKKGDLLKLAAKRVEAKKIDEITKLIDESGLEVATRFIEAMPERDFTEKGGGGGDKLDEKSAYSQIEKKVAEKRKEDKDLEYADALILVCEENPDLAVQYEKESKVKEVA